MRRATSLFHGLDPLTGLGLALVAMFYCGTLPILRGLGLIGKDF